jgi:hypothetical protein
MHITIEEIKPMGGVELIVDGVFNCPVWIEGDITTYPKDDPTFTINEVLALIDPADDNMKLMVPTAYAITKLMDANFFTAVFEELKNQ